MQKNMIILTTISNVCNVCYNKFVQQNLKPFFSMFNTPSGQTPPTEYNYQFVTKNIKNTIIDIVEVLKP